MSALQDRDTNVQMASSNANTTNTSEKQQQMATGGENKAQRTLEQRIADANNKQSGPYISPSDAILSPATQKLAGFKQRQINKQNNSNNNNNNNNPTARSLFSRTASSITDSGLEDSEDLPGSK
ncbi:Hypothetical predicted protein [Lecanosticta acicola]|uniref:Uncharacterized protein n=1 Tax=Lecanosticta acicola TaxID=111012 RepID=A0AAI8YSZ4_9PEZI|nr:Hypothetical predicted protein [Lecanosticta acicola]